MQCLAFRRGELVRAPAEQVCQVVPSIAEDPDAGRKSRAVSCLLD